jgi:ABC-2 type transport system ATP-binding protein
MEAVIHTEKLTKRYGKNRGIVDVDLDVYPGEIFGFLGPNGAGKTTTIRTLLDFIHPTSGRASIFGFDTQDDSVEAHALLGNLPGEYNLDQKMTGEQLIRYYGRLRGVTDFGYAGEVAERLGAEMSRPLHHLSRGNKQKIGIVQALFHRPPLLILDEPTTGLDPLVQDEFLHLLEDAREEGRTVFFSSHVLSEVERVCDHVGIVREGELVALETTETLIQKRLRRMSLQFASPIDLNEFAALPGVSEARAEGNTVHLTLNDGIDGVIKVAAQHTLIDVDLRRPSLEEIFLAYYGATL